MTTASAIAMAAKCGVSTRRRMRISTTTAIDREQDESDLGRGRASHPARESARQPDADLKLPELCRAAEPLHAAGGSHHEDADRADRSNRRGTSCEHPPALMDDQGDDREKDQLWLDRNQPKQHAGGEILVLSQQVDGQQGDDQEQRVVLREAEFGVGDQVEQQRGGHGRHHPVRKPAALPPEQPGARSERHPDHDLPQVHRRRDPQGREGRRQERHHRRLVEVPDEIGRDRRRNNARDQMCPGELHRSRVDAAEAGRLCLVCGGNPGEVGVLRVGHGEARGGKRHRCGSGDTRQRDEAWRSQARWGLN